MMTANKRTVRLIPENLKFEIFCVLNFYIITYIHYFISYIYIHRYNTLIAQVQILNSTQFLPLIKIYSYIRLGFGYC
jgi:hypothetical protein